MKSPYDVQRAYNRPEYDEALAALQSLQHELEDRNQSAAGSLAEGLDETLTLHRLGVYGVLGRSLKTTNGLESINALIEERCAKVDHWQNSSQRQRWLATALLDIEPRLRKVMGYRHLPRLRDVVVGGAGHVGAPLSIVLASRGLRTLIYDLNEQSLAMLRSGRMPFLEDGAEPLLRAAIAGDLLGFSSTPDSVAAVPTVIVTIGTPIDEFQNPSVSLLTRCMDSLIPHMSDEQLVILRSTVAPGVTDYLAEYLKSKGKEPALACCPERVVQGKGIQEIQNLPQLVSGTSRGAVERATALFAKISPEVVELSPKEAEYAKLISNAYRYIQFAATNQFYMMVEADGLDYNQLLTKMKHQYSRMDSFPSAGFAAGPCLMKDTMQLFAFRKHDFILGQVAMTINEGLPNYLVSQLEQKTQISGRTVGILGMAFKAESDDIRDSLSYKLKKILEFQGAEVLCSDEFVRDEGFVSKEEVLQKSDVLVVGVPHAAYRGLETAPEQLVMDVWGVLKRSDVGSR